MKQIACLLTLILALFSCNGNRENVTGNLNLLKTSEDKIRLHKLKKQFVVGDFDGEGTKDTILEHNYSRLSKIEIKDAPDPSQNEWDAVVKWFYNQKADLYLSLNISNKDTLHLGTAQGLYCLINIGDSNADGKDEIALVIDYLDFSSLNSCRIYTLCNNQWVLLKDFKIHESSFESTTKEAATFDNIPGFMEKRNEVWCYKDYLERNSGEEASKMRKLMVDPCK